MKTKIALFLLCLCSFSSFADLPYNALWQQANAYYQQKDYERAATVYDRLAAQNPDNAEVYYNLGNSYYKLNRIGPAVLSYKRALKVDPGFQPAADNLELTIARIPNRVAENQDIFFVSWWKSLTSSRFAGTWAVAALLFFIISLLMLALRRYRKEPSWMVPALPVTGLAFCFIFLLLAYTSAERRIAADEAVVMVHDAPLTDTGAGGKGQSLIPEGTVVTLGASKGKLVEVVLPDGRAGWMNSALIQKI